MIELCEGLWWRIGLWPAALIENRYKNGDVETRLFVDGCRDPFVAYGLTAAKTIELLTAAAAAADEPIDADTFGPPARGGYPR